MRSMSDSILGFGIMFCAAVLAVVSSARTSTLEDDPPVGGPPNGKCCLSPREAPPASGCSLACAASPVTCYAGAQTGTAVGGCKTGTLQQNCTEPGGSSPVDLHNYFCNGPFSTGCPSGTERCEWALQSGAIVSTGYAKMCSGSVCQ